MSLGNIWRASISFRQSGSTLFDPTTVQVQVVEVEGDTTATYTYGVDPEVVRLSAGSYYIDITPSAYGTVCVSATGLDISGDPWAAADATFTV